MQHLMRCPLLENECSLEDLATANEKALHCAKSLAKHMIKFGDDGHERRLNAERVQPASAEFENLNNRLGPAMDRKPCSLAC